MAVHIEFISMWNVELEKLKSLQKSHTLVSAHS